MVKKELVKFSDIANKVAIVTINRGYIGADPELFLKRSGRIIGSEKVITETNLVVEDGVQVELHPYPHYCREIFADNIRSCMWQLKDMITGTKSKAVDDVSVAVTRKQYNSLKPKNKQFGCGVSYNTHKIEKLTVDPSKYLKRSAGGHMHFGKECLPVHDVETLMNPSKFVPLLDILVGNTAVMLDRDEGNKERRKYYGLAGEYRTPKYGLEYRTLSNFWLRGYPLMSLVFGLARHALSIGTAGYDKHLLSIVDMDDIIRAINTNDYDLAKSNWDKYKQFIVATANESSSYFPIATEDDILFFERIAEEGIDKYFSHDIIGNWISNNRLLDGGWSTFQYRVLEQDLVKKEKQNVGAESCH